MQNQAHCLKILFSAALIGLTACTFSPEQPPFTIQASVSSPIARSSDGRSVWVVNPDANSLTRLNTDTLEPDAPVAVGEEPWSVTVTPNNTVLVVNRQSGTLSFLEEKQRFDLFVGAEPAGVALSPSGRTAFVTVSAEDAVAVVDVQSRQVIRHLDVGHMPWSLAVTNNGDANDDDESLIVTHRYARLRRDGKEGTDNGKEGWLTIIKHPSSSNSVFSEAVIAPYSFGYANGLEGLAVQGDQVFVLHLLNSPQLPTDLSKRFETTVSSALSTLSISSGTEHLERRININDPAFSSPINFAKAVVVTKDAKRAFIVLAGTDAVMGVNLEQPSTPKLIGFWQTGKNPRGLVLSSDESKAYVMNFLSRDVSVLDLSDMVRRPELKRVAVTTETLAPALLRGKILFNNANDPRISHLGWISCATCHLDGGVDGTTWVTPNGLRQTQALWNLSGTAPFHASGTRDEVQDFETDIEGLMDGIGLAPGQANRELGVANGGQSQDLDALAKYVLEGIRVPNAPQQNSDAVARGRTVFQQMNCVACHAGSHWTNSSLHGAVGSFPAIDVEVRLSLQNVGTFNASSDTLGAHGFDVQTLLGLHSSAPYLHDGSAPTLADVLENPLHAKSNLSIQQKLDLVTFLESIDSSTPMLQQ
jgi:YVTN family beta-propeller protein